MPDAGNFAHKIVEFDGKPACRCWNANGSHAAFLCKKTGAESIELEVRSDNEAAIALYKKFGFEKVGTNEKFFKINGEFFAADYMNLYL